MSTLLPVGPPYDVCHPFLLDGSCCPWPSVLSSPGPFVYPWSRFSTNLSFPLHRLARVWGVDRWDEPLCAFFLCLFMLFSVPLLLTSCSLGSQMGLVCVGPSVGRSRYTTRGSDKQVLRITYTLINAWSHPPPSVVLPTGASTSFITIGENSSLPSLLLPSP